MHEVLELKDVCRNFSHGIFRTQTVKAVDHVSFSLERGKTFGLFGNSGCGKTTLSRMITGLIRPTGGTILFENADISDFNRKQARQYHRRVQMIFQNPEASLDPSMKIRDSLLEAMEIHRLGENREERMQKVRDNLKLVDIPETLLNRYPHQISGGESQRIVICRALLLEPELLILDEPTSMLDVSVQAQLMNILRDLQTELGLTYLYITHDLDLLAWISHTVGVMHRGKLVEVGSCEQVMSAPAHAYTKELLQSFSAWR